MQKKEKSGFGSGVDKYRKSHVYTYRLTEDQKRYRIIKVLDDSKEKPLSLKVLLHSLSSTQRNVQPEYFDKLIEKKIIIKELFGTDNTAKYKIGENGELLIKTLKDLKTRTPDHPIFEFDVFNTSTKEEEDENKKENFDLKFRIESNQNNEKEERE